MPEPDLDLLSRAREHAPRLHDPAVAACWPLVIGGIELGWLAETELRELAGYLRDGRDWGVEELLFASLGDVVRVTLLDDEGTCAPRLMADALDALLEMRA